MDPIANLKEQLELARRIQSAEEAEDNDPIDAACTKAECADRLAELVIALDEWMRKGGFSPWQK